MAAIANACDQNGKLPVRHAAATRWWASLDVITTLLRSFVNDPTREQSYTCLDEKEGNFGRLNGAEDVFAATR